MKYIDLYGKNGKGKRCMVSEKDFGILNSYIWFLKINSHSPSLRYARRKECGKEIYMHRQIIGEARAVLKLSIKFDPAGLCM